MPAPEYYTVRFCDFDGREIKVIENVAAGSGVTPPADPTRDGYVFTGWSGSYANITANTTLVAQYAPVASEICTVVFVDWNGNELKRQSVNKGESATAPETPERTGYRFVKWDKSFDNVTENVTVTAVYIRQYTVVFEDKDGDVLKTEIVDEGASATPPAAPEVEGYTFTGWEGNYSAVAQNEIVTAKYVENAPVTFTVKFVDWNEDVLKTETVRKGSGATAPADPTRDGYVFKGWDKVFDNVTGDMTVTAVYEEVAGPYVHCSEQSVDMGSSVTLSVNLVDCSFPIKRLSVIFTDNSNSFVAEKGKWSNDYDYVLKPFDNELLLGSAVLSEQIIVDGNVFNLTLHPSEAAVPGTYTISVALTVSYFDDQENEHEVKCRPTEVNIVIK